MLWAAAGAALLMASIGGSAAAQDDQQPLLDHIRELMVQRDSTRFVMPMPGSRSNVLAIDVSTPMYFYLERGAIRGSAIDSFYAAYEAGDFDTAYQEFLGNAIMIQRVTDYGWNGLGNPMVTESGAEIGDLVFKDVGGVFARAAELDDEDRVQFMTLLQTVIAALEGGT